MNITPRKQCPRCCKLHPGHSNFKYQLKLGDIDLPFNKLHLLRILGSKHNSSLPKQYKSVDKQLLAPPTKKTTFNYKSCTATKTRLIMNDSKQGAAWPAHLFSVSMSYKWQTSEASYRLQRCPPITLGDPLNIMGHVNYSCIRLQYNVPNLCMMILWYIVEFTADSLGTLRL